MSVAGLWETVCTFGRVGTAPAYSHRREEFCLSGVQQEVYAQRPSEVGLRTSRTTLESKVELSSNCKHARRHPNFDPTVLRQRRPPVKAFSVNSSDGTPSEHSIPSP
ncbi:hypothetical protein J6590_056342, partial [Homalodisca vitripennis]